MRLRALDRSKGGFTIIEALLAMAVLAIVAQAFAFFLRNALKSTVKERQKVFATEKAIEMLEELRGLVLDGKADIASLDNFYDDHQTDAARTPKYKYTLTTKRSVTHPGGNTGNDAITAADPLSDNPIRAQGGYTYVRHIEITSGAPLDPNIRKIHVRVYYAAPNAAQASTTTAMAQSPWAKPLADIYGVVHSLGQSNPPSQVMDLYLVALETVPGWWSRTSNLIPIMSAAISSVQARNPGLRIRPHWIKRLSYGRDIEYTPEVNEATAADVTNVFKKVYIYPGLVSYDATTTTATNPGAAPDFYYLPSYFDARVNIDGTIDDNQGYPVADQFNHAMRLPDEERLYSIHQQVALNAGSTAPEPSLRQLLQRLNDRDPSYLNSIIVNLHGEMLPVVPLRNVSDPAKAPEFYWTGATPHAWRVVTHPERLRFDTASQTTAVRVYAYDINGTFMADSITAAAENQIIDVATLFVPDASLANLQKVSRLQGNSQKSYIWNHYDSGNWVNAGSQVSGSDTTWIADDYTTPTGRSGLRIRLFGVTPTARTRYAPIVP